MDGYCSCGSVVRECPFWSTVLRESGVERFNSGEKVLPLWPQIADRSQGLNRAAALAVGSVANLFGASVWSAFPNQRDEYVDVYRRFHSAAKRFQGTDIFIDGS